MQINHPIWPFGLVKPKLSHQRRKKTKVTLAQRACSDLIGRADVWGGPSSELDTISVLKLFYCFGGWPVLVVILSCEFPIAVKWTEKGYWNIWALRFQQEKMKVVKANFGNQEFRWTFSRRPKESVTQSHSGSLMTKQNCWLRCFYVRCSTSGMERNFCTFPQPGSHTHRGPSIPLPVTHTDTCV